MSFYTDDSPIIACSTGSNANTAIAVIRLSGFKNLLSLQPFFSLDLRKVENRKSHLTNIIFKNKVFDNGLMVFFPEGQSYTGENVLELSVHGNQLNIMNILKLFTQEANFKIASPGEFTYRALKNKKLTLSQVEGLDLLLNANSSLMLSQGLDILQGDLHSQYKALYEIFLKLKASVELSIDFSDDVGLEESDKLIKSTLSSFIKLIQALKSRTEGNISSLLSPEIALVGQTNAGKSSMFNALLKHDRSIVSNIAGTTRDYISEVIHIDGNNYKLVDTAGIRDSKDSIENIGIERALNILERSFFKILIVNPFETDPKYLDKFANIVFDVLFISHWDEDDFDSKLATINLSKISTKNAFVCTLKNSDDGSIGPFKMTGPMGPKLIGPIEPEDKAGPMGPLKPGPIEPELKSLISYKYQYLTKSNPILLERHRAVIGQIYEKSMRLSNNIKEIDDIAILSSEINMLGASLTELIGIISPEDVLNSIFANFCIGK